MRIRDKKPDVITIIGGRFYMIGRTDCVTKHEYEHDKFEYTRNIFDNATYLTDDEWVELENHFKKFPPLETSEEEE
jgi:hypothetical protein